MSLTDDQIVAKNYQDFYNRLKPYLGFTHGAFTPIGSIVPIIGTTAPAHYLACDGSTHSIAAYPELAEYFKDQFGASNHFGGDGTNTFAVPDIGGIPMDSVYCIAVRNIYYDPANYYSTGEQVVGKWIDGKPLYQRTYLLTSPTSINTSVNIGDLPDDYDFIKLHEYTIILEDSSEFFTTNSLVWLRLANNVNGRNKITCEVGASSYTSRPLYVTLQYTKTTD